MLHRRPNILKIWCAASLLFLACITLSERALSQSGSVPVNIQYALFVKILSFDRTLGAQARGEIVIGVVYEGNSMKSSDVKSKLVTAMEEAPADVKGMPVRYMLMDLDVEQDVSLLVARHRPTILYVAPIRAAGIEAITTVSRAEKILTLTGVPQYVESGLAVGVGVNAERPQIIVNLPAAKSEGVDFDSQLLRIARVIQ